MIVFPSLRSHPGSHGVAMVVFHSWQQGKDRDPHPLPACSHVHRLCILVLLVELCDQAGLQKSDENLEL